MIQKEFNGVIDELVPSGIQITELQMKTLYKKAKSLETEEFALFLALALKKSKNPWDWVNALKREEEAEQTDEGRCAWVSQNTHKRCTMRGEMSPSLQGGGPWYCSFHTEMLLFAKPPTFTYLQEWHTSLQQSYPNHHLASDSLEDLWNAIEGQAKLPARPPVVEDETEMTEKEIQKAKEVIGEYFGKMYARSFMATQPLRRQPDQPRVEIEDESQVEEELEPIPF